jgi:hypothetical protein
VANSKNYMGICIDGLRKTKTNLTSLRISDIPADVSAEHVTKTIPQPYRYTCRRYRHVLFVLQMYIIRSYLSVVSFLSV